MRVETIALLVLGAVSTAHAAELPADALTLTIDRQGYDQTLHRFEIVGRLTNGSDRPLRWADVRCDFFEPNGKAVGTNSGTVRQLAPGRAGVVEVGAFLPAGVDGAMLKAECRVTENYAD